MFIVDHILFPTDFSARSHAMLPTVEDLARRFGARVTVLHVLETPSYAGVAYELLEMDSVRRVANRQLEAFGAEGFAGVALTRVMLEGHTASVIVEAAREMQASLIAIPTAGYTRFRELLLGSVTSSVLHDAEVPVLTSAHTEDAVVAAPSYEKIVCAIDLSEASVGVMAAARDVATRFGSQLHVVHAVPAVNETFASGPSDRAHRFLCGNAREKYPALAKAAGVTVELELMEELGSPADGIAVAVKRHGAGLVVAGRGQAQGFLGRLRTNIHELLRKSPAPVLSV
jgi:nucleotide-binding universal stress UspA family protein